jgi:uncharacterized protein
MKFVVLFEDDASKAGVRAQLMPDHQAFLKRNAASILSAGPLLEPEGQAAGGLWLVESPNADAAMKLVHEDPFWPTGLRKSVRVLFWKQVFADGKSLL